MSGNKKKVEIIRRETAFDESIFRVERARLRYERFDGHLSQPVTRLSLERGDGVSAVLHKIEDDSLLLIEQFRYPAHQHGEGWLLELAAGIVGPNENPAESMRRELLEETGYRVDKLEPISTFYPSPGGCSERIFLYYAAVTEVDKITAGGGVPSENEDIRSLWLPRAEALAMLNDGRICDAKTIIGLQWLILNRP